MTADTAELAALAKQARKLARKLLAAAEVIDPAPAWSKGATLSREQGAVRERTACAGAGACRTCDELIALGLLEPPAPTTKGKP